MRATSIPVHPGPLEDGGRWLRQAEGPRSATTYLQRFASFLRGFAATFFPAGDAVSVPLFPGCPSGPHVHTVPTGIPAAG